MELGGTRICNKLQSLDDHFHVGLDDLYQEAVTEGRTISCGPTTFAVQKATLRYKKSGRSSESYLFALYIPWHCAVKLLSPVARGRGTGRPSFQKVQRLNEGRGPRQPPPPDFIADARPSSDGPSCVSPSPFGSASQSPGDGARGGMHTSCLEPDERVEETLGQSHMDDVSTGYGGTLPTRLHVCDWQHALETWFGVDMFLTLAPSRGLLTTSHAEVRAAASP